MWKKAERYYQTLKYLKKSQIPYLVKNRLERGKKAITTADAPVTGELPLWIQELDGHEDHRKRFDLEELLDGKVTLLYESGRPEGKNWNHPEKSHLWNFNLHYLEFLIPLAAAYRERQDVRFYEGFREYCLKWIEDNKEGSGDGWHPYTISLRLTNLWICMDGFGEILQQDKEFLDRLKDSMYAQYLHLQKKLELHLLGNHYLENLKAVLLGAVYFQEPGVYRTYRIRFQKELKEQILEDGAHYERSPMYHKIVLEDVMRAAKGVKASDPQFYEELRKLLQKMADVMYSLENGMGQTPLFNDSGDNVARSMISLLDSLREKFQIIPVIRHAFPEAGYYGIENGALKLWMDAGEIAPSYMPGHGHCDGLSFELSYGGHPVFVNSGTGQYQGTLRSYFRSTAAHNTVVIDGKEQSQCWGEHRVGKRIRNVSGGVRGSRVFGKLTTCNDKTQERSIAIEGLLVTIRDQVRGYAQAYFHLAPDLRYELEDQRVKILNKDAKMVCGLQGSPGDSLQIYREGTICSYAPEFGKTGTAQVLEISWQGDGTEHEIQIEFYRIEENI